MNTEVNKDVKIVQVREVGQNILENMPVKFKYQIVWCMPCHKDYVIVNVSLKWESSDKQTQELAVDISVQVRVGNKHDDEDSDLDK